MSNFKILITGGLGYIGGRIADFLKRNHPASCIVLGTSREVNKIPNWANSFQIVRLNILEPVSIEKAVSSDFHVIIHLAALNEQDSFGDIKSAWETNAWGTQSLLSVASKKKISKFIYFSTFHVYGAGSEKITEESPTNPHHPYASTHRAAEDMARFFKYYKKMNILILRLSNGFGYPMDLEVNRWTLVFNDLCRQAMTSGEMILRSSGKQHRDFISLHDIAASVEHFLFSIPNRWEDGLYNLGGNCSLAILDVAKKIALVYEKKYGKPIPIQILGKDNGEANYPVQYNIDKLRKTGFQLTGNMEMEIEQTLSLCENFTSKN